MSRLRAGSATRFAAPLAALVLPPAVSVAQVAGEAAQVARPAYTFLRFREDWSVLRSASEAQRTDLWDPIKYVPLSDDGRVWASFGGHARARVESWSSFNFGEPADDDDTFGLGRLLLHGDLHLGRHVRVFVEGKSALATGRDLPGGTRTLDVDALDLEQAFVDLKIPLSPGTELTVRPGRQALLFGRQRLVSPLAWSNTLRRWDGVSAILSWSSWTVHGFWTQFVPIQKYDFNDADDDVDFYGVYATSTADGRSGRDLYWLALDRSAGAFNGTAGGEQRHTFGARTWGEIPGTALDYEVEAAYQFGEVGAGDVSASMVAVELGYGRPDWPGSPRFELGLDHASGDESSGGDVETFNQLFPLGHAFLGSMDFVGRQNVIDLRPRVAFAPMENVKVGLAGHLFWRAEAADALYNAGGAVVRAGAPGTDRFVGSEIDLTVSWRYSRHVTWLFGYSHFFAGDFIEQTGPSDDMDFLYLQWTYTF